MRNRIKLNMLHQLGKDNEEKLYVLDIKVPIKENKKETRVVSYTCYGEYISLTVQDNTLPELKQLAEEILAKVTESEKENEKS